MKEIKLIRIIIVVFLSLALTACSTFRFPGVHRITIQQGNVITQQMIDKLRPGMTRSQVKFVLGNAVVDDQLDANRWDYIHTIQVGGGEQFRKVLSVYFVEDRLSHFVGGFVPTEEWEALTESAANTN